MSYVLGSAHSWSEDVTLFWFEASCPPVHANLVIILCMHECKQVSELLMPHPLLSIIKKSAASPRLRAWSTDQQSPYWLLALWTGIHSSDWLVESCKGKLPPSAFNSHHCSCLKRLFPGSSTVNLLIQNCRTLFADEMIALPHFVPLITSASQQGARPRRMWRIRINNSEVDWNLNTVRERERVWFMQRAECEEKSLGGMLWRFRPAAFLVYSFGVCVHPVYCHVTWRKRQSDTRLHNSLFPVEHTLRPSVSLLSGFSDLFLFSSKLKKL